MATKYSSKLHSKSVLILGGTSGIGFCVAEAAVEFGARVTVASSRQSRVDAAVAQLAASYPFAAAEKRVRGHVCDLGGSEGTVVEENITRLLEFATEGGARKLDHVVHTAGDRLQNKEIGEVTSEDVAKLATVRFTSTILLAKLAAGYMNASSASSLTITGGVMAEKPAPGWSVTASLAAAKSGMAKALAVDLKPIRVNIVAPGAILTELWDSFGDKEAKERMAKLFAERTLLNKVGLPEDMAEAYLYIMRDAFITGQTILSDGGYVLM